MTQTVWGVFVWADTVYACRSAGSSHLRGPRDLPHAGSAGSAARASFSSEKPAARWDRIAPSLWQRLADSISILPMPATPESVRPEDSWTLHLPACLVPAVSWMTDGTILRVARIHEAFFLVPRYVFFEQSNTGAVFRDGLRVRCAQSHCDTSRYC